MQQEQRKVRQNGSITTARRLMDWFTLMEISYQVVHGHNEGICGHPGTV